MKQGGKELRKEGQKEGGKESRRQEEKNKLND